MAWLRVVCLFVLVWGVHGKGDGGMDLNDSTPPTVASVLKHVTAGPDGLHDVQTEQGTAQAVTPVDDSAGASVTAQRVANTLNGLGHVLQNMYKQVETDEEMFKAFKEQVLEDEVAKTHVDLSWPAIKDLVKSEVAIGRQNIDNQLSEFKVDVLDVVQRGLDALRTDLRATVTAGYVAKTAVAPPDTSSVDEDEHLPKPSVGASIDQFVNSLNAPADVKKDIETYVQHKLSPSGTIGKLDDYGVDAMGALREMEDSLRGKLSAKDLRSEIFSRLEDLTRDYLKHPSPSAKAALEALKSSILASLNELKSKAESARRAVEVPVQQKGVDPTLNAAKAESEKIGHSVQGALKKSAGVSENAADKAVAAAEAVLAKEAEVNAAADKMADATAAMKKQTSSLTDQVKKERGHESLLEEEEILPLP